LVETLHFIIWIVVVKLLSFWLIASGFGYGKIAGIIKPHDPIVVCQKVGDSSLVKIIELE
jgi:hypothetical protein